MKGAFFESKGSVWKKAKIEQQLEILCFFRFSEKKFILFSKSFCNDDYLNAFRLSRKLFDDFWRELFFFFFHFWTLTVRFLHFVQTFSTWAKHFRPFGQRFLTGTLKGHLMRPFKHIEIFWVTLRKIQEQIEKKSKTSKIFVTWDKTSGQLFFDKNVEIAIYVSI